MNRTCFAIFTPALVFSLLSGCATSPEIVTQRELRDAHIEEVLGLTVSDAADGPVTERCLRETEYRNFRALDDRHILFEGRRDRLWINRLPHRCPDLRYGEILIVRSFSSMRLCEYDQFSVADWFNWPWYRRWPWEWRTPWHTGVHCVLGEFHAVSAEQVAEIRAIIRDR